MRAKKTNILFYLPACDEIWSSGALSTFSLQEAPWWAHMVRGKINESCETRLGTSHKLQLSPSGSMGLIGWQREGRPSSLPFSVLRAQRELAVVAPFPTERDRFSTLMSKLCGCCNNLFRERWLFAVEVDTVEELLQMLLSVSFLGIKESFCSYRGKESFWGCALIVQMQSSDVTDRWRVEKAQLHLYNQWKVSQRSDRFFHTYESFPKGVDPQDSRTD